MENKKWPEPSAVWSYFEKICQIPRPSFKTEKMQQWLMDFAEEHHLEAIHDKVGNVLIRKPASPGKENAPVVLLQAHMDMVCEKNSHVQHDFEKDPIQVKISEDGWMAANGTTLGADNGIGMAMELAVLDDDTLEHGPIECLFTVDEEVGLIGASGLEKGLLKAKMLINLDSEDEGQICIGCAGGINTLAAFRYQTQAAPDNYYFFRLTISGLQGGHSGTDIVLNRGNANQLLARFLWKENKRGDLYLADFVGGNLSNAIPREASFVAAVPFAQKEELSMRVNLYEAELKAEFGRTEPNLQLHLDTTESSLVLKKTQSDAFIAALYACPNGVLSMNREVKDAVEASSNLAAVKHTGENEWTVVTSQRSDVESCKRNVAEQIAAQFTLAGMEVSHTEGYPGWKPNPSSLLLKTMVDVHKDLFGYEPLVYCIHAGLECGLFAEKYPHLDMVSVGPTMRGVHSPDEKLYMPAVADSWKWLTGTLKLL